ncbi:alpha/beta hydrolase [bacterium]|nr:alpha/beta hydrolase [bacterium]
MSDKPHIYILPGWHNSEPNHWQSRLERGHSRAMRIEQEDWESPVMSDWVNKLDHMVQAAEKEIVLVAHSLGSLTVAHYAENPGNKILGAMLTAPVDPEIDSFPEEIRGFAPCPTRTLPFPHYVVGSRNDPWCNIERAQQMAADWGGKFVDAGEAGHINAESGYGPWPEGLFLLSNLLKGIL